MPFGLDPVADESARVLILGSMPGEESLARREYYGHPRNQFWQLLYSVFGAECDPSYRSRIAFIQQKCIALWDVIESCDRRGSADARIKNVRPNNLMLFLSSHPGIKAIFFNGEMAYRMYKKYFPPGSCSAPLPAVLPSTSPANARMSVEAKLKEWRVIKEYLGDGNPFQTGNQPELRPSNQEIA
jgi:methylated-DNA-[protein]-cysteine S-methyltransferase